jgi:hypothetical protein
MKIRYWPNITLKHGDYSLDVTRTGTVYWNSGRGKRKLDTLWLPRKMVLAVSLPNEEEIHLKGTDKGIIVLEDIDQEAPENEQ